MPYVQRDDAGKVSATFANKQDSYAEEWLDEGHPDLEPASPPLPDLAPYQFRAMLKLSGKQDDLYAVLDALPEPDRTVA